VLEGKTERLGCLTEGSGGPGVEGKKKNAGPLGKPQRTKKYQHRLYRGKTRAAKRYGGAGTLGEALFWRRLIKVYAGKDTEGIQKRRKNLPEREGNQTREREPFCHVFRKISTSFPNSRGKMTATDKRKGVQRLKGTNEGKTKGKKKIKSRGNGPHPKKYSRARGGGKKKRGERAGKDRKTLSHLSDKKGQTERKSQRAS